MDQSREKKVTLNLEEVMLKSGIPRLRNRHWTAQTAH